MSRAIREQAVRFGRGRHLVGVITHPSSPRRDAPGILFLNSGIVHHIGANRLHVRLARALASHGYPSFRFDLSGIGDSEPPPDGATVSREDFVAADIADAEKALEEATDVRSFVLVGLCSGADDALAAVGRSPARIGAVALDPDTIRTPGFYIRHAWRNRTRPGIWKRLILGKSSVLQDAMAAYQPAISAGNEGRSSGMEASRRLTPSQMRDRMREQVSAGVQLLYVFTGGLPERYNYHDQFARGFRRIPVPTHLRFRYMSEADHSFSDEAQRDRLESEIVAWMQQKFPPSRSPEA